MASFTYQASDSENKIVTGVIDAVDKNVVARNLIDQGLTPIRIKDKNSLSFSSLGDLNAINIGKIPIKDRVIFFRQLSVLITSGIPIVEAINISANQVTNKGLHNILLEVQKSVESGKSLSDSFSPYSKLFSNIQIQLLRTAEASGSLDYILDRIATDVENQSRLLSKFKGAMIYPILVVLVAIAVIGLVLTQMIPPMKNLYESFHATLPWPTLFVINLSNFFISYWIYILIVLIIIIFVIFLYTRSTAGKKTIDILIIKIPILGNLIKKIQIVDFGKTFILLNKAGVPLVQGLNLIADSLSNTLFKETLKQVSQEVEKGRSLGEVMSQYDIYPPLLWRMISIGEETGNMEGVVSKVVDYFEEETNNLIENLSKLLEPIITIFLGVIVGFIGVAVYLPIYTLGNVIK